MQRIRVFACAVQSRSLDVRFFYNSGYEENSTGYEQLSCVSDVTHTELSTLAEDSTDKRALNLPAEVVVRIDGDRLVIEKFKH